MEHDESFDPLDIGILGADAVMQSPNRSADAIEQLGPPIVGRPGAGRRRRPGLVCIIHEIFVVSVDSSPYNPPNDLDYTPSGASRKTPSGSLITG